MTAGAGGTQYNVLTSIDQGGGNKKQGLVSTTNTPVALDSHIRVRGGGHNRNWVFCMNQLGGVGRRWGQSSGPGNRAGVSAVCHRIARKRRQDYPAKPPGANVRGWGAAYKWKDWRTGDNTNSIQFAGLLLWPSESSTVNKIVLNSLDDAGLSSLTEVKQVGGFNMNAYIKNPPTTTDIYGSNTFWTGNFSNKWFNTVATGSFKSENPLYAAPYDSKSQSDPSKIQIKNQMYVFGGAGVGSPANPNPFNDQPSFNTWLDLFGRQRHRFLHLIWKDSWKARTIQ
jgi:hypothetical protein